MRIISGRLRGKRIQAPAPLPSRPTTDRAKESLFQLLSNRLNINKIKALDLFSGTGNISYELASRGCPLILSIDKEKACVEFIRKTAELLGFEEIKTLKTDALDFVQRSDLRFDLIFADPPFEYERHDELAMTVIDRKRLLPGGVLVIEHSKSTDLSDIEGFEHMRNYGNVSFSFFSAPEPEA